MNGVHFEGLVQHIPDGIHCGQLILNNNKTTLDGLICSSFGDEFHGLPGISKT